MSYYQTIDGMKCDKGIIEACQEAVKGQGDGRVSLADAKKVFEKVADGGVETRCERWTVRHCLTAFKFTAAAHDWFIENCAQVPQSDDAPAAKKARTEEEAADPGDGRKDYYEVLDGAKCDRAIVDACREAVKGQGDGRVSLEDAKKVFEHAEDGNILTRCERWTIRYCLTEFKWTEAAQDWIVDALQKVPGAESHESHCCIS
uniref:Uncharacterized protein n=1 Tax=Alexandrium andersonii TaxID=327968 RepID=A0A7S2FYJ4_9DINO